MDIASPYLVEINLNWTVYKRTRRIAALGRSLTHRPSFDLQLENRMGKISASMPTASVDFHTGSTGSSFSRSQRSQREVLIWLLDCVIPQFEPLFPRSASLISLSH